MNKERLLKLAEHLEKGQLGHEIFSFTTFNSDDWQDRADINRGITGCGTSGCAIGECPFVWPEEWSFDLLEGMPVLRKCSGPMDSACKWFGLTDNEACHLFLPGCYRMQYGGNPLGGRATKDQVAANIRAFVAHKEINQTA